MRVTYRRIRGMILVQGVWGQPTYY
ncbi:hypothetical protein MES4922_130136 [Mesorhizobium ventifaucium]|uniref:Uncharacterized protein n=1 Tax=Mesorhizobium ventifaucium TaxID=666020 RepID=A0ABM9DH13_9HYPH|nr:hypothetical protein MES4922_130136 [Mesorhizobium ventifaucium]